MASTSLTRTRSTLVAGTAVLVVVTATGSVSAHEGGTGAGTLHACVTTATGAVRVLADAAQQCRANETPVHWTVGDGSSALAAFRTQLITPNNPADLVDWSNLAAVPGVLADGIVEWDELGGAAVLPADSVTGAAVADGSLTSADLADGSVSSADILDSTVLSEDLAAGAVTAADLAGTYGDPLPGALPVETVGGAVTSAKIADRSVEPRDMNPEVAVTAPQPGAVALSSTASVVGTAVVTAAAGDAVTLTGQVQLSLAAPCGGCTAVVTYQLVRGSTPVGPAYQVQLSDGHAEEVASVAFLDTAPTDGSQQYGVRLSTDAASTGISASNPVLVAQVLGRP